MSLTQAYLIQSKLSFAKDLLFGLVYSFYSYSFLALVNAWFYPCLVPGNIEYVVIE